MKNAKYSLAALVGLAASTSTALCNDIPLSPIITSINVSNNQALVTWTNGRPNYLLQTQAAFGDLWMNVGSPTSNSFASVPISGTQAFFRVISDYTARYQVVFNATWSQSTHPVDWTTNAHWSGLVGGTHNEAVHFFRESETASAGIQMMAELGQKPRLLAEVGASITNGTADFQLSGGGIRPSPGTVSLVFSQPMRRDFPLVTLCSMIAPSPDWFVGVDSLSLLENGQWLASKTVTLYSMDAGTDSGATYESPDQVTIPRSVVTRHIGFPALQNGVIVPFGTFTFTRLD